MAGISSGQLRASLDQAAADRVLHSQSWCPVGFVIVVERALQHARVWGA